MYALRPLSLSAHLPPTMANPEERREAKKGTNLLVIAAAVVLLVLGAVFAVQACHEPNTREDIIDPDDPLPGTQDATGWHYDTEAAPLLAA